jgi:hypothetical protein
MSGAELLTWLAGNVGPAIGTLLTGAIAGWFGAYIALRGKRQFAEWQQELTYRQDQLSALYGPVYAIVSSQIQIFDLWNNGKMAEKNFDAKNTLPNRTREYVS